MPHRHSIIAVTVAMLAALVVSGCTATMAGPLVQTASPAPTYSYPRTIQLDPADVAFEPEEQEFTPAVGWIDEGDSIRISTRGSSSCPTIPLSVEITSPDKIVVTVGDDVDAGDACTSDFAPHNSRIDLPDDITGRPLNVDLKFDNPYNQAEPRPFVLP